MATSKLYQASLGEHDRSTSGWQPESWHQLYFPLAFPKPPRPGTKKRSKPSQLTARREHSAAALPSPLPPGRRPLWMSRSLGEMSWQLRADNRPRKHPAAVPISPSQAKPAPVPPPQDPPPPSPPVPASPSEASATLPHAQPESPGSGLLPAPAGCPQDRAPPLPPKPGFMRFFKWKWKTPKEAPERPPRGPSRPLGTPLEGSPPGAPMVEPEGKKMAVPALLKGPSAPGSPEPQSPEPEPSGRPAPTSLRRFLKKHRSGPRTGHPGPPSSPEAASPDQHERDARPPARPPERPPPPKAASTPRITEKTLANQLRVVRVERPSRDPATPPEEPAPHPAEGTRAVPLPGAEWVHRLL
ncbi:vegetative cell wall protein gp1-like [Tachyglossus aculeatus]|uniref:vegetative cell wall protein gp1-like n=1 Tax=Tachyglossus aculeatus TaxID=9261 RepID=UPI0018F5E7B6|nr:vegetative cell wall protein gp1-like [Tachyglossus aculeatus]